MLGALNIYKNMLRGKRGAVAVYFLLWYYGSQKNEQTRTVKKPPSPVEIFFHHFALN